MTELSGLLLITVILALLFDFSNGWHDCANAVATVVSTRVLSPIAAVLLAGLLNVAGAFFSTAVAKMIGGGIVFPDAITNAVVAAAMGGAILWNFLTLMLGLPTSSSHALIGGLVGSAVAHGGWTVVQFQGLHKILEAMIVSPLMGFVMGFLIMILVGRTFSRVHRGVATKIFSRLQVLSASFMAFSHGANDAQKVMGIITLALVASGQLTTSEVPTWVIVSCALAMGLGTTVGGWRIIRTLGIKMVKLEPVHGFAAETGAAAVLLFTAHFGLPVSTTHTITSSILGVGSTKRLSAVRWGVTRKIFSAWIFTLPGAALLGAGVYALFASFH
ncbi:MAG: inorganic phosphate transporter [Nitrospira sp.]|nr:inorganic phosphate transporter [Nitrospira sp.]